MISIPWFVLYGIVFALLCFACAACASTMGPAEQLESFLEVALKDRVLSKEELETLVSMIHNLAQHESSQIDWPTFLTGLAGTAVSSVLGVNVYRNRTRARALELCRVSLSADHQ